MTILFCRLYPRQSWSHHSALLQTWPLLQQLGTCSFPRPWSPSLEVGSCLQARDSPHVPALSVCLRGRDPSIVPLRTGISLSPQSSLDAPPPLDAQVIPTQTDALVGSGDDAQGEHLQVPLKIRIPQAVAGSGCHSNSTQILQAGCWGISQGWEGAWTPGQWDPG